MRPAVLGLAAVLLLAGCATTTTPAGPPPPPPPSQKADPIGLVGLWTVRDADEEPGTILRLGDDLSLWKNCGHLDGEWSADTSGQFLTFVAGGSDRCFAGRSVPDAVPDWLPRAVGYRADGADRLLLDRTGRTVARLVPGGTPKVDANTLPSVAAPPVVTEQLRQRFAPAAPLPAALRPATAADLTAGRWIPADGTGAGRAFVTFGRDGTWSGSDGCNGQGGAWLVGPGGSLLLNSGAQTLIGCAGADIGGWLSSAARAGFDGDELVLLNPVGGESGRLRRG